MPSRNRVPNEPSPTEDQWENRYDDTIVTEGQYWEFTDYDHPDNRSPSLDDSGPGGSTWLEYYALHSPPQKEYDPLRYVDTHAEGIIGIELLHMIDVFGRIKKKREADQT